MDPQLKSFYNTYTGSTIQMVILGMNVKSALTS